MPTDKTVLVAWKDYSAAKELSTQVSRQVEEERAQAGGEGETFQDMPRKKENPGTDRLRAGVSAGGHAGGVWRGRGGQLAEEPVLKKACIRKSAFPAEKPVSYKFKTCGKENALMKDYQLDTLCIHAGYQPKNGEPRVAPIVQSTTYVYESSKEMGALFDLQEDGFFYTRLANPTNDVVEKKIAALEGAWAPAHLLRPGCQFDGRAEHLPRRVPCGQFQRYLRRHL